MMAAQTLFILLIATLTTLKSQLVKCNGGPCQCPETAPTPGAVCILDCNAEDICKKQDLTCREGDPCEILCEAKASCSSATRIFGGKATDVTIICSEHDACKDDIQIVCGTGHCHLQCDESTACEDFGSIDVSLSKSFNCVGTCPGNLPKQFTALPTTSAATNPTPKPTKPPTLISQTFSPTQNTIITSISATNTPTLAYIGTEYPSRETHTTANPTKSTPDIPTSTPTIIPTKSVTKIPTVTSAVLTEYVTSTTIEPILTETLLKSESEINLHSSQLDMHQTIISILAVGTAIMTVVLCWVIYTRNKKYRRRRKLFGRDHVAPKPELEDLSPCPSKSPSTYAKSLKSVYSTTDRPLGSVRENPTHEGNSQGSSSSDELYVECEMTVPMTGKPPQLSMDSVVHPLPTSINRLPSNSAYYYYTQPGQQAMPQNPYMSIVPLSPPSMHFPSVSAVSYNNYISALPPIIAQSPHPSLPSISILNENENDILPAIPDHKLSSMNPKEKVGYENVMNAKVNNDLNDLSEYSQVTVTSNAMSDSNPNSDSESKENIFELKKTPNDVYLEKIVCTDLDKNCGLIQLAQNLDIDIEHTHTHTHSSLTDTSAMKEYKSVNNMVNDTNKLYVE